MELEALGKIEKTSTTSNNSLGETVRAHDSPNSSSVSDENDKGASAVVAEKLKPGRCTRILKALLKWQLPVFLISGLILGYAYPSPGRWLDEADLGGICFQVVDVCLYSSISKLFIAFIFVMSGMKLKTSEMKHALKCWKAALFGIVSIVFVTPCISLALVRIRFAVPELAIGFAIFFAQATSLSSGQILTAEAKGTVSLALLLTVVTNIISVFTMPIFVSSSLEYYLAKNYDLSNLTESVNSGQIQVDLLPIILELLFTILLPLGIGKLLCLVAVVRAFAENFGNSMKMIAAFFLAAIVWMKVSSSADDLNSLDLLSIFACFATGFLVHVVYLLFNYSTMTYVIDSEQSDKRAIVIVSSQKTLPVAITVLDILPPEAIGSRGLAIVPIIICQFVQIVMDAYVAAVWASIPHELDSTKENIAHVEDIRADNEASSLSGAATQGEITRT